MEYLINGLYRNDDKMDAADCPVKAAEDDCVRIEDDQVGTITDHSSTTTDWQVQTDQTGRLFYIRYAIYYWWHTKLWLGLIGVDSIKT